ncbi:hypothetical protein IE81DRAFT_48804 [Ceraceosorus guamensis]|uniref:Uncharacterized protein n=1 Tax=Ceraceosorus guamensis TaxID=1522189 RepID=A0A316VNC8_9BASI|nr:hypothetical protein IE81DRAFT_48804 [Ceraceosorus guamensis]PWN39139.1 hypothetical protein IE81DRAFT_48804 [Ceraceosorus guamensis]
MFQGHQDSAEGQCKCRVPHMCCDASSGADQVYRRSAPACCPEYTPIFCLCELHTSMLLLAAPSCSEILSIGICALGSLAAVCGWREYESVRV